MSGSFKDRLFATPEGRAAWEEAQHCQHCGALVHGREARRLCAANTCTIWDCPDCGRERGSACLIDCKVCNWSPWWGSGVPGARDRLVSAVGRAPE